MQLPREIEACPIREAVFGIVFDPKLPGDAIFGVVYNDFKDEYTELIKLPILQLPEMVRTDDPNLTALPLYRLEKPGFAVLVGPKTIGLSSLSPYPGWTHLLPEIQVLLEKVRRLGFVESIIRFGLRYINVFDGDVIGNMELNLTLGPREVSGSSLALSVMLVEGGFSCLLQLSNRSAYVDRHGKAETNVTLFDIDVSQEGFKGDFFQQSGAILDQAHEIEKNLFFSLLKPDFLETLNPKY